jgi:hypothetical protein
MNERDQSLLDRAVYLFAEWIEREDLDQAEKFAALAWSIETAAKADR